MSAGLIARNTSNQLLFDTRNISYGLVKSGNLTYVENWRQLRLRGINVDPNIGSSWVEAGIPGEDQFGFILDNPVSPIVFIVGKGVATGVKVINATSKQYLFACSSPDTKYYCFDLMKEDSLSGPGLITRNTSNQVTFNSRQPALNVVAAIQAPTYGVLDRFGRPVTTYINGRIERIRYAVPQCAQVHCVVDIPLDSGYEYAAFLPWNRACGIIDTDIYGPGTSSSIYGVSEGAYGRVGGISFIFGTEGYTTQDHWTRTRQTEISYYELPADRFPVALVIKTENLPFPFG